MTAQPLAPVADDVIPHPATREELKDLLRRLATARSRVAECEATAAAVTRHIRDVAAVALADVEKQTAEDTAPDRQLIVRLVDAATLYLTDHIAQNPDGPQSITTEWGTVSSRSGGNLVTWPKDDAELREWATGHGFTHIKFTESVNKAAIKKACHVRGGVLVAPDGSAVPGVTVEDAGATVTVLT